MVHLNKLFSWNERKKSLPFPATNNSIEMFLFFGQLIKVRYPYKTQSIAYKVSFAAYDVLNCDVLDFGQFYHDRIDQQKFLLNATITSTELKFLVTDNPAYAPL